jgi:hypothetical protein
LCDHGYCARHDTARERISMNPTYEDWREVEQWRHEELISSPDFNKPPETGA